MVIHSFRSTLPRRPSCFCVASRPSSAMNRNGLLFFSPSAPCRTEGAFQNFFCASLAWHAHLVLLVDLGDDDVPAAHRHEDEDAERGLGDQVAAFPERFETVRIVDDFRRLRGGHRAPQGQRERWPRVRRAPRVALAPVPLAARPLHATAISRAAANAARRILFNMWSPDRWLFVRCCQGSRLVDDPDGTTRIPYPQPDRLLDTDPVLRLRQAGAIGFDVAYVLQVTAPCSPPTASRTYAKTHWPRRRQGQLSSFESRRILHKTAKKSTGNLG